MVIAAVDHQVGDPDDADRYLPDGLGCAGPCQPTRGRDGEQDPELGAGVEVGVNPVGCFLERSEVWNTEDAGDRPGRPWAWRRGC